MTEYGNILFTQDEIVISSLGHGYLQSILSGQGINKLLVVLTQKRLYLKGRLVELGKGSRLINMDLNVADISGSASYLKSRRIWRIIILILGVLAFIVPFIRHWREVSYGAMSIVSVLVRGGILSPLVILLFFGFIYILIRDVRYLSIIMYGSEFTVLIKNYQESEVESFRRELALLIQNKRESVTRFN
jgi:hypothetical protein